MADNLGPMAWLLLPENEQVQYLQKIALRAENPFGPRYNSEKTRKDEKAEKEEETSKYFLQSNFLSPLRRQFSGLRDGLLKPNVSNPFSQKYQ